VRKRRCYCCVVLVRLLCSCSCSCSCESVTATAVSLCAVGTAATATVAESLCWWFRSSCSFWCFGDVAAAVIYLTLWITDKRCTLRRLQCPPLRYPALLCRGRKKFPAVSFDVVVSTSSSSFQNARGIEHVDTHCRLIVYDSYDSRPVCSELWASNKRSAQKNSVAESSLRLCTKRNNLLSQIIA
jgi:hypothetical protein